MHWILEPIGYLCLGDCQKSFVGARDKTIVFDVLLKKEKEKKNLNYDITTYKSWCISIKRLNVKFSTTKFLKYSSSCQLQMCSKMIIHIDQYWIFLIGNAWNLIDRPTSKSVLRASY